MTRLEKWMVAAILAKWPEIDPEDAKRWIYRRHHEFDDLSPSSFENKFGQKRWKKRLLGIKNFN